MAGSGEQVAVSVFGIGYVGAVTSACISDAGFDVVAVDINPGKAEMLARGESPIVEPGLPEMLKRSVEAGRLSAITDTAEAIARTNLSIICVGTPSQSNGNLDLSHVADVCEQIGEAIKAKDSFHSVVMRSTMLPGSMKDTVVPLLERASGKKAGEGFGLAYYPEFLRESTAIADYENPAVIVLGVKDETTLERLRAINERLNAPEFLTDVGTAEAIKYANNCWHAVKITFANEIGNIAHACGLDGQTVMAAVCADNRLNISPAYMKPGMAFGGSCLPKDLRALRYKAKSLDVKTPLLDAVHDSNENQIDRAFRMIASVGKKRVGMLGLSFKAGTDDLRESPNVEIAERLHGKGYRLQIFDRNVHYSSLSGANLSYINAHLPHLRELLTDDMQAVVDDSDLIVVGNSDPAFREAVRTMAKGKTVVDLVRIEPERQTDGNGYLGLCW